MNLKKKTFLVLVFLFACASIAEPEKTANLFMESYYQKADLETAQSLADGLALNKIRSSLQLREGQAIDETTHQPKIRFKKIQALQGDSEATYLFEIRIEPDNIQEIVKTSRLKLRKRDGAWRVTQFSEFQQDLQSE